MPNSLQCPRCNGSVSITDSAAGKRVKCPHCEQTFLAPGIASDSNSQEDEDDWLTLNDSPAPASSSSTGPIPADSKAPGSPVTSVTKSKKDTLLSDDDDSFFSESSLPPVQIPNASTASHQGTAGDTSQSIGNSLGPDISAAEEELLSQFTDTSMPTSDAQPPVKKNALDAIRALGAVTTTLGSDSTTKPSAAPQAAPIEYQPEFRVTCKICGTLMYAKAVDSGKTTKCSDCHSEFTIPKAPKVRKEPEIDIANAATFSLGQNTSETKSTADPFKKSADALLAEASRQEEDTPSPRYEDTPNVLEWIKNQFGIFQDPGVIMHWVILSVVAAIPTALLLSIEQESLQWLMTVGMMIGGLILGAITVSCAFAILLSVANDNEQVEDWPSMDIFQWLDHLVLVLGAVGLVAVPMWSICYLTDSTGLLGVALVMFSIYLLLPFILLSMLDMGSVFTPFSPELARSVSKCQEEWGGFYFSSALLFGMLFLFIALASSIGGSLGIVASITLSIFTTFSYFGMMGRLAYTIGQSVNAPPKKNDADRSRPTDPQ
ncbi:MAG: hypothetical protein CBE00_00105 [Planctomycetaceae bacterium TMED240]|nr:hypothetical protein [Rhodopirellula sp.]OUX09109.1 MAG: hypothetical protein CBE00_00105 [Planctomycetaceae bacterium TMED240]